jgi:hypothetical protein
MKMPDDKQLNTMWSVAISSSIEDGSRRPYEIFARLLYNHLTNVNSKVKIYK